MPFDPDKYLQSSKFDPDAYLSKKDSLPEGPRQPSEALIDKAKHFATGAIPYVTGAVGGVIGSGAGPAGAIVGGAGGYTLGRRIEDGINTFGFDQDAPQVSQSDAFKEVGKELGTGAALEAGGMVAGKVLQKGASLVKPAASKAGDFALDYMVPGGAKIKNLIKNAIMKNKGAASAGEDLVARDIERSSAAQSKADWERLLERESQNAPKPESSPVTPPPASTPTTSNGMRDPFTVRKSRAGMAPTKTESRLSPEEIDALLAKLKEPAPTKIPLKKTEMPDDEVLGYYRDLADFPKPRD